MTPLDEIFDRFYSLIKDTDLAKLDDEDLYKLTKVYYEMAATRFKECKNNLELVQKAIILLLVNLQQKNRI